MIATDRSDRVKSAAIAAVMMAGLLWALIAGLAVGMTGAAGERMPLFSLAAPPPPAHVVPPPHRTSGRKGASAPANIRSTASDVVAPPPPLPLPPPPMPAAPVADTGVQTSPGAASVAGPGSGAGGSGNGAGSGGDGDGGGGGDRDTPPRRIGGRIRPGDLPDDLAYALASGVDLVVAVRYAVEIDGSVDECRITHSSGHRALDILTCELIERKFRYRPALDEDHRPFKSYIVENHAWNFEDARDGGR